MLILKKDMIIVNGLLNTRHKVLTSPNAPSVYIYQEAIFIMSTLQYCTHFNN